MTTEVFSSGAVAASRQSNSRKLVDLGPVDIHNCKYDLMLQRVGASQADLELLSPPCRCLWHYRPSAICSRYLSHYIPLDRELMQLCTNATLVLPLLEFVFASNLTRASFSARQANPAEFLIISIQL